MPAEKLFSPREAAQVLGVSYPTLKLWIYKKKIRTIKTAGGHHRIPERQLDKFLHQATERGDVAEKRTGFRHISGRNQLIGRVTDIKISGLIAQVSLSIGGQHITSIITADAVREMRLKVGDKAAALIKSTEVMILRA
ncbi:MAG: helix-turn-helix transcriptional regulator [Candidatus Acidiferrum sp.]